MRVQLLGCTPLFELVQSQQCVSMSRSKQVLQGAVVLLAAVSLFTVAGCKNHDSSADGIEGPNSLGPPVSNVEHRSVWSNFDFGSNNTNVYVALGDSITGECGYPEQLEGMLGDGKAVYNEGIGGEESVGGLGRVDGVLRSYEPGYLLVLYGANDLMHEVPILETVENLRGIVRQALAAHTLPLVATVTPQPRYAENRADLIGHLNAHIMDMAEEENVPCVDLAAEFEGAGFELFPDGLHPNSTGARIIAMTFYEALQGL